MAARVQPRVAASRRAQESATSEQREPSTPTTIFAMVGLSHPQGTTDQGRPPSREQDLRPWAAACRRGTITGGVGCRGDIDAAPTADEVEEVPDGGDPSRTGSIGGHP